MGDDNFDDGLLTEKLSKVNGSQQSIESVSRWCIIHRKRAKQVVETWERLFKAAQREQQVAYLYLSNDILQNSRRKGSEFVNEFWKVLPAALKGLYSGGGETGRKVASRLVDIWEERKVFGSRGQNLKNDVLGGKSPPINNVKNSNPIKVMKRDSTSLRVKLAVGGLPEKILTSLQLVHDEAVNEEVALNKYRNAVSCVREIEKDVVHASSQGNLHGSDVVENIQKQENTIQQCISELVSSEAARAALVSQLREALQDQESKLEQTRSDILVARGQIEQASNMRQQLALTTSAPPPVSQLMVEPTFPSPVLTSNTTMSMSMPMTMPMPPPTNPLTSFANSGEEDNKKATAAAVAAKLAASTSSAQMLTSILSSLVAEEAASMSSGLKRPKLEPPMQFADANFTTQSLPQLQPPFLPPPPQVAPPTSNSPANQLMQSNNMMGLPYGFGGVSNLMPPNSGQMGFARAGPPPPQQGQPQQQQQQQVVQNQQAQPQQQQQQQPTSGGYYRSIGVGFYGQSHQPPTPTIQRQ